MLLKNQNKRGARSVERGGRSVEREAKTIGILGGGQLGRMLAQAGRDLGLRTHIFCPKQTACAIEKADEATCAAYDDEAALRRFATAVDVITFEFENIPLATAALLEKIKPQGFFPSSLALATAQDRAKEKRFLNELGIETAHWCLGGATAAAAVATAAAAVATATLPAIVKTRRFGYDGKGQISVQTDEELRAALKTLGSDTIIETKVPFDREIAFCAARAINGEIVLYPAVETFHRDGILREVRAPATLSEPVQKMGAAWIKIILEALNYVGLLAVEMFEVQGQLRVNEIAPRVHNSYHWTLEGAATSQFHQHLRAIAGLPLGAVAPIKKSKMINIIGADNPKVWQNKPRSTLHLYNKGAVQDGRKMGHITLLLES